jgi:hypothetical protein
MNSLQACHKCCHSGRSQNIHHFSNMPFLSRFQKAHFRRGWMPTLTERISAERLECTVAHLYQFDLRGSRNPRMDRFPIVRGGHTINSSPNSLGWKLTHHCDSNVFPSSVSNAAASERGRWLRALDSFSQRWRFSRISCMRCHSHRPKG